MLKRLENKDIESVSAYLPSDAVSLRIKANLTVYKADYPFCEFWAQYNEENEITAVLSKINGACTLTFSDNADTEELISLIHFIGCSSLFLESEKADALSLSGRSGDILVYCENKTDAYEAENFCDMKEAFKLISENESESIAKLDYLEWLSDFTFKSNRSAARLKAITRNGELVSLALTSAETKDSALISGVFTREDKRKKGFGEKVLLSLVHTLENENKKIYIMTAEERMTRYYEKRGFKKNGFWTEVNI